MGLMAVKKGSVAIVRTENYITDEILAALDKAVSLSGGIAPLKKRGKKLLLKLNMLAGTPPERATTTHPAFFEAAILYFHKHGFQLYAGDSPGIESTNGAGKRNGLMSVALAHGVEWVDFADTTDLHNEDGKLVKHFRVAKIFTQVDAVVSLPKLKTHSQMYYTGALKNMFGAIPGLEKSRFHVRFPERDNFAKMIVDLNCLLKPDLSLMDGIIGMEGNGPQNGDPIKMGVVLASYDALALDTICCKMIGYDPLSVPILKDAYTRGIWITSPDQASVSGASLESVSKPDFKKIRIVAEISLAKRFAPPFLYNSVRNIIVPRPVFNKKNCIVCKRCVEICQAGALSVKEKNEKKFISIDYNKCIRCYCCHEICPANAVILKKGVFR